MADAIAVERSRGFTAPGFVIRVIPERQSRAISTSNFVSRRRVVVGVFARRRHACLYKHTRGESCRRVLYISRDVFPVSRLARNSLLDERSRSNPLHARGSFLFIRYRVFPRVLIQRRILREYCEGKRSFGIIDQAGFRGWRRTRNVDDEEILSGRKQRQDGRQRVAITARRYFCRLSRRPISPAILRVSQEAADRR